MIRKLLIFLFFILMMCFPVDYNPVRGALLVICLGIALFEFVQGKALLSRALLLWLLFYLIVALSFSFRGMVFNADGAIRVLSTQALWPVVFTFLAMSLKSMEDIYFTFRVILYGGVGVGLIALLVFIVHLHLISPALLTYVGQTHIGSYAGGELFKYANPSISTSVYVFPFSLAIMFYLFQYRSLAQSLKINKLLYMSLLLTIVVIIFSGRKVAFLQLPLFFIVLLLIQFFVAPGSLMRSLRKLIWCLLGFIVIVGLVSWFKVFPVNKIFVYIAQGFNFSSAVNMDAHVRYLEFFSLISGWLLHPIIGSGYGAHAVYIVSPSMPWAYELTYIALLFQLGLLGLLAYVCGIAYLIFELVRICRTNPGSVLGMIAFSSLMAMILFLIANATNPYLTKFSYMWILVFPVAIINYDICYKAGDRVGL